MLLDRYVEKNGARCEDMNMDIQRKQEKNKKAYEQGYKLTVLVKMLDFFL